uniref:Uncharacterized protein n=1 Tax=Arundo donax TaxID=35708 RepID=A0A0A9HH72_ARUDO
MQKTPIPFQPSLMPFNIQTGATDKHTELTRHLEQQRVVVVAAADSNC